MKAALVGPTPTGLEHLLEDVLDDVGIAVHIVDAPEDADVVFPLVRRDNVVATICSLKQRGCARILALLSVRDERLARRAIDAGARVCFSLDSPTQRLSFLVLTLLADARTPITSGSLFRLGPRGREVMQELRVFSARQPEPTYRIYADAEKRVESAIRADYGRRVARPFRLGINGKLETTLMRLDSLAIERLERAIDADLDGELGRVA